MKKLFNSILLIFGIFFGFTYLSFAQDNPLKIGVGLNYGTEIEQPGIEADGYYRINDNFRAGLGLTYFFPNDIPGGDYTWFSIDLNGNYIFYEEESVLAYGLAGINITSISLNSDNEFGDFSASTSETGLNIGAGVEYGLNFGNLFGELKYGGLGGNADQFVFGAGVRFGI